jgi:hypothetical protein
MWEKNSNLDKSNLPESPFIKITYHVRGCMAFRLNELDLALMMAYFVETRPYPTRACPLGWRGIPQRMFFVSSHEKCVFHFWSVEIGFFYETATKTANRKLGTTPHINNIPHGVHISALVSSRKSSELFFGFYANSCRFRWNRGGFAL